jgi:hypothetical protein
MPEDQIGQHLDNFACLMIWADDRVSCGGDDKALLAFAFYLSEA